MSVSVETDLGTNLAQEGGFSLAENRSSSSSMAFASPSCTAHKMAKEKGMDETSLCGEVRGWPTWKSP